MDGYPMRKEENLTRYFLNLEIMTLELPQSVAAIPLLCHLHIDSNFFSGQIPPEYHTWQHLQYLALFGNELASNITPELENLSALHELYIGYYNTYSGSILPKIGNLSNLVRLDAAYCGLSSKIRAELGKL
ncbi:Leucine-rich repeat receptor-like serine/threonine-protein kinase BAM1 [Glycine soja]